MVTERKKPRNALHTCPNLAEKIEALDEKWQTAANAGQFIAPIHIADLDLLLDIAKGCLYPERYEWPTGRQVEGEAGEEQGG